MYFNEDKTFLWWCGNFLVIFGVMYYTYGKINERIEAKISSLKYIMARIVCTTDFALLLI
jgi:hypothetical protein